jgi:hypothetical protein
MTAESERAAFLTALAQDPGPVPVFGDMASWALWNPTVVAGFDPATGYGCAQCATEIKDGQRGTEAPAAAEARAS